MNNTSTLLKITFATLLSLVALCFSSCEDMLEEQSNRVIVAADNDLNSSSDTIYSVVGILAQLQNVADRYILQGELRGDLIDVTDNTSADLRELSTFTVDTVTNKYCNVQDYYGIINNCNYFLQNADTALTSHGEQTFLKEYGVVKTIRAWTYLQLGTTYNSATYYTNPLLSVKDIEADYPNLDLKALVDTLITDVESVVDLDEPDYGEVTTINFKYMFIDKKFLLGELYLWKAALEGGTNIALYEKAAQYFTELIYDEQYTIGGEKVTWTSSSFTSINANENWSPLLSETNKGELISIIPMSGSAVYGKTSELMELMFLNQMYAPSSVIANLWSNQIYAYPTTDKIPTYTSGDLRAKASAKELVSGFTYITKHNIGHTILYRSGLLYLRLAEAINRSGYPGMAFAILKYGLNSETINDDDKVPAKEFNNLPSYLSVFNEPYFDENMGIHSRGCGKSGINARYEIPISVETFADSVNMVEEFICDELALETAFEGNRFTDLMRLSYHRNNTSFLAARVAQKHIDFNGMLSFLSNDNNWYLPISERK